MNGTGPEPEANQEDGTQGARGVPQPPGFYDVDSQDPDHQLVDRAHLDVEEQTQINALMGAMGELRRAEERLSDASLEYMKLGKTDMRALHFLIVAGNTGQVATATTLAAHLEITSASTTKLLDRLARGGHITRTPHPEDRRSTQIHITATTKQAAMETVGKQQARRFSAAARLSPAEREVVIRFLRATAGELTEDMDWG